MEVQTLLDGEYDALPAIDRWMLARHADVMREVKGSLDAFQFRRALAAIEALPNVKAVAACLRTL